MSARDVDCPVCPAGRIGQPCRSLWDTYEVPDHPARIRLASALAGPQVESITNRFTMSVPESFFAGLRTLSAQLPPDERQKRVERRQERMRPLTYAVLADLSAIVAAADLSDFPPAPRECPPPPPELTDTYAVAFASAARRCTHRRYRDTTYARRERQCMDCGRYFTGEDEW